MGRAVGRSRGQGSHVDAEPDDGGVSATLDHRLVAITRAVGAAFMERDPGGTYLYQTIQELGNARPTYAQVFAAAQAEPVSIAALAALNPILFGRGEHDHVSDEAPLRELASLIPGSVMVTLPGSGHSLYFETPAEWNDAVHQHVETEYRA
jgi:3-oxoadipate enol-lactonase